MWNNITIKSLFQVKKLQSSKYLPALYFNCRYLFLKKRKMPKEKENLAKLKNIRIKEKKQGKSARYPPGEIYLSVLGNGSKSSARALYLFTDHERYLFNCGEGTQRLAYEHRAKLAKLDNVFITHRSWDNIGGLFGLSLTLQDMGVPKMTLHGPPDLDLLFEDAKSFIVLKSLEIKTKSYTDKKFSDDVMDIHYIPIFKNTPTSNSVENSPDIESQDSDSDSPLEPRRKKLCTSDRNQGEQDMVLAFACKGHSKPGTLLFQKCIEFGVPPGPLLGDLKKGKDITLSNGKTVFSKDVTSEAQNCPVFLVVECPSLEFLSPFVSEEKFCQYQILSKGESESASLIVHFTPPHVMKSPEYQQWMNKFPDSSCHLVLNSDNATLNSAAIHRIQYKLNLLHPGIFSLLHENDAVENRGYSKRDNIVQANTLDHYHLRPSKGLDKDATLKFNPTDFVNEALETEGFEESLQNLKKEINNHSFQNTKEDQFPAITFLGTGSSIPSKVRNVSSILISISENKYIFLDCGEGTHSQLMRLFGDNHEHILEHLMCIFISHMHADHHLGLVKLIKAREKVFKKLNKQHERLILIGPKQLRWWLKNYHNRIEPITYLYRFFNCSSLGNNLLNDVESNAFELSKNIRISTVPVKHCHDAHGIVILLRDSKQKIVYSGDTMPCEGLVEAGENCFVLIHEATMEDELLNEALLKKHSTTSQAIKIGADMKSKYTILTHFSQRYAKIPLFNENFHNFVGCAFDNMTVHSSDLHILPLLIPTLKCLFAEDIEEMNIKGNRRRKEVEYIKELLLNQTVAEKT